MSLDPDQRLALTRHADLKSRRDGDVLVLPERAIRIGGSGGEILHLCDGSRSTREVIAGMQARYPDTAEIESQVVAFLEEMLELGGLVAIGPEPAGVTAETDDATRTTQERGRPQ